MLAASLHIVDNQLICQGSWTITGIVHLQDTVKDMFLSTQQTWVINGENIEALDTAGACFLHDLVNQWRKQDQEIHYGHFPERFQGFLDMLGKHAEVLQQVEVVPPKGESFLYKVGKEVYNKYRQLLMFLSFIGEFTLIFIQTIGLRKTFQWRSFIKTLDEAGYQALPIIALLSFLIGVVLAYQMGLQLRIYGANVYIVNVTGLAILREFAPLITAIIAAGRTSSALTAKIGTMIVNEEVDALRTMGISPMVRLVFPQVLAVVIALPLLTVWADIFGVMGSMVMSKGMLGLDFENFLHRFQDVIPLKPYVIGIIKAPVFGLLVAAIGCFQGMQVSAKAESVGHRTTTSVVQAIFAIIVADALFSVLFSWQDI